MLNDAEHPLFGKETTCHQCSGVAVWVFNGDMVGNYHYCRACKIETGPFAANPPAKLEEWAIEVNPSWQWFFKNQIDTQMRMQDRMEQLLFDFMKPPGETL